MRVSRVAIVVAVSLVLAAAGCAPAKTATTAPAGVKRLRVSGSGTCLPLLRILASQQPDKSVRMVFLPGLHSKGGIQGVEQDSLDVGAVSRALTKEESSGDLEVTWLSTDGLVVAVNPSVSKIGVTGVTDAQLRDIYSGRITDWKQLGASRSLPIIVLDRHEDESAKIIMRQYVFGPATEFSVTPRSVNLYYESDMVDALQSTVGSIGYFSLGYAISQNISVSHLTLNGVTPTVANIQSGAYKLVRPLGIVVKKTAQSEVKDFVRWAKGPEARRLMLSKGYAPYDE